MTKVLIVGSVALDTVKTPYGTKQDILGGSCSYASLAASFYSPVNMVGVIGTDFPREAVELFQKKGIDLEGLEYAEGKTFRWKGYYENDMNQAHTLETHLNVFGHFSPKIPDGYKETEYVFLANIHPSLQLDVLQQIESPKFVVCDTMNLWIDTTRDELLEVISKVDLMLLNEAEVKQLCDTPNIVQGAQKILEMGPQYVIIKKGENGAILFDNKGDCFISPAYPLQEIIDPTGAGDTFAGGMMGIISHLDDISIETIKRAIITGNILASFTVQDFSLNKLSSINLEEIYKRYQHFEKITSFKPFVEKSKFN